MCLLLLGSVSILPLNHSPMAGLEVEPVSEPEIEPEMADAGGAEPQPGAGLEPQREPALEPAETRDMDMLLSKAAELLATATSQADPSDAKAHYQGSLSMFEAALAYVQQPIAQCVTACPNRGRPLLLGA